MESDPSATHHCRSISLSVRAFSFSPHDDAVWALVRVTPARKDQAQAWSLPARIAQALPYTSWQIGIPPACSGLSGPHSILRSEGRTIRPPLAGGSRQQQTSGLDGLVQQVPLLYFLLLLQCQEGRTGILQIFPAPSLPGY